MIWRMDVKFVLTLVVTSVLPMIVSVYLMTNAVRAALGVGLNKDIAASLDDSLKAYRSSIEYQKIAQELYISGISKSATIEKACVSHDKTKIKQELKKILTSGMLKKQRGSIININKIIMDTASGNKIVVHDKSTASNTRPVEKQITLNTGSCTGLTVVFGVDTRIVSNLKKAALYTDTYKTLFHSQETYLIKRVAVIYVLLLGLIVVISVWQGVMFTRRLTKRIHLLGKATRGVANGDLSIRVDPGRMDEAGELIRSFNMMVSEIESTRAKIEYLQKISAWQEIARRLAHEIKNPLTPIHLASQQIKSKYSLHDPDFKKLLDQSVDIIEEEVSTLKRLVSDFSSFAKLPEVRMSPILLSSFLKDCESSFEYLQEQHTNLKIIWTYPAERIMVSIDTMLMKRVMDNIVRNAVEAFELLDGINPQINIYTQRVHTNTDKDGQISICIQDNGPGIPKQTVSSVFEPYYTTKDEGTGLGLAICKKIVLEHNGMIVIDETEQTGTLFLVNIPIFKTN
jgi:nitrogen fixation/metabolism regulation signal transduction histidine kinase